MSSEQTFVDCVRKWKIFLDGRYLPLQDDISAVVYWYQTLPHKPFPPLPGRNDREII